MSARIQKEYPAVSLINLSPQLRKQRTIKQPCEIEAVKAAVKITRAGILAMMKVSRPGLYEYQYKAEFDHALEQYGVLAPAFPSIVSAGKNNFCIHYYEYMGQVQDGDMILNDVGPNTIICLMTYPVAGLAMENFPQNKDYCIHVLTTPLSTCLRS